MNLLEHIEQEKLTNTDKITEYREKDCINYSVLSQFAKGGLELYLDNLYKKEEKKKYFTLGSLVDNMISYSTDLLQQTYHIVPDEHVSCLSQKELDIINNTYQLVDKEYPDEILSNFDKQILFYANEAEYQLNWKDQTRIDKIKEKGELYIKSLIACGNKEVVSDEEYKLAYELKSQLLNPNTALANIQNIKKVYLQHPMYFDMLNYHFKCLADLIIETDDTVYVVDFKTTSDYLYNFKDKIKKYNYYLQAFIYINGANHYFKGKNIIFVFDVVSHKQDIKTLNYNLGENTVKYPSTIFRTELERLKEIIKEDNLLSLEKVVDLYQTAEQHNFDVNSFYESHVFSF